MAGMAGMLPPGFPLSYSQSLASLYTGSMLPGGLPGPAATPGPAGASFLSQYPPTAASSSSSSSPSSFSPSARSEGHRGPVLVNGGHVSSASSSDDDDDDVIEVRGQWRMNDAVLWASLIQFINHQNTMTSYLPGCRLQMACGWGREGNGQRKWELNWWQLSPCWSVSSARLCCLGETVWMGIEHRLDTERLIFMLNIRRWNLRKREVGGAPEGKRDKKNQRTLGFQVFVQYWYWNTNHWTWYCWVWACSDQKRPLVVLLTLEILVLQLC